METSVRRNSDTPVGWQKKRPPVQTDAGAFALMGKPTAILIDGGWFCNAFREANGRFPTADIIHKNAVSLIRTGEEDLVRIFYYDSMPHSGIEKHPITKQETDYSKTAAYSARLRLFRELGQMDYIALRRGVVRVRGWELASDYTKRLMTGSAVETLSPEHVKLAFEQKGVDMRIGIDVATLALKKIVLCIILVSGDADMIPAMKLARREGVQVVLVHVGNRRPSSELIEDADFVRELRIIT